MISGIVPALHSCPVWVLTLVYLDVIWSESRNQIPFHPKLFFVMMFFAQSKGENYWLILAHDSSNNSFENCMRQKYWLILKEYNYTMPMFLLIEY